MTITVPRGTKDILPSEVAYWQTVESTARNIFSLYNFSEIRTPLFESTALFNRVIGESSDIIQKEMYTFTDKGGRDLSLRPEGTAPVARAYLSNHLGRSEASSKLYYMGPMFRYERPQAGRYRQFHQIGAEWIGIDHPYADAELISLCYRLFTTCGLSKVKILINTVGSAKCRPAIEEKIKAFLKEKQIDQEIVEKYADNPLRVLDSKNKDLQAALADFPDISQCLSQESKDHFEKVLSYLDALNIPYERSSKLVRGLDYYTETVFEVVSEDLGAQNSICGGGRYNHLIEEIGGKETPAVGFAFGIERLIMLLEQQKVAVKKDLPIVYVASVGEENKLAGVKLAEEVRNSGFRAVIDFDKTDFSPQLKRASKLEAAYMLIYGDEEAANQMVQIKDMKERTQESVSLDQLQSKLIELKEKTVV